MQAISVSQSELVQSLLTQSELVTVTENRSPKVITVSLATSLVYMFLKPLTIHKGKKIAFCLISICMYIRYRTDFKKKH